MDWIAEEFRAAHRSGSGPRLAETLLPPNQSRNVNALWSFHKALEEAHVQESLVHVLKGVGHDKLDISRAELGAWADVYAAFWRFLGYHFIRKSDLEARKSQYESWREVNNAIIKGYSNGGFESWTLPCLYVTSKWLRNYAIEADKEASKTLRHTPAITTLEESDDMSLTLTKNDMLEDAARVINRMFTLCITDRAAMIDSRKWALYYITNLLFKTYFKLNSVSLCKNPWRALQASHIDMPPIEAFPKAHICAFQYYVGLMFFLEEDYRTAEANLLEAYRLCHVSSPRNRERILTYLIPCRLMTSFMLPGTSALVQYAWLQRLFTPLCKAIKSGNLAAFDESLAAGERDFVQARIYLTLERGRDICIRNLFRKVFLYGGYEQTKTKTGELESIRRTRIPIWEFVTALRCSLRAHSNVDKDEVECLLANAIFKGHVKGYIARERGVVVLSKGSAFPGTGI